MEPRGRPSVKNARVCYRTLMAEAPLIGVTTSVTTGKEGERAVVNAAYVAAVQRAGGVPVLLPPQLDDRARAALFARLHGALLTGGGDVNPALFEEERHKKASGVRDDRDGLELALVGHALAYRLPVLAICRGVQVLNVALGGSLYQDITSEPGSTIVHTQTEPRDRPTHLVKVMGEGTRLGAIAGGAELPVNSFHHQALKRLGRGLRDVAWAPDGIVEGVAGLGDQRDRRVAGLAEPIGMDVAPAGQQEAVEPLPERRAAPGVELGREEHGDPAGLLHGGEVRRVHVRALGILVHGDRRRHADERGGSHAPSLQLLALGHQLIDRELKLSGHRGDGGA